MVANQLLEVQGQQKVAGCFALQRRLMAQLGQM
jgi:hypothetical protein